MKKIVLVLLAAGILISGSCASSIEEKIEYRLQPTDVLAITVHNHQDLATKTRVTADGYISFPLLGKVFVKGLTVQELEANLREALEKDYLVNAPVLVFIEEYHPRQVSVLGEVNNPGKYDMPEEKNITLLEAIAMAGGFTKDAAQNETKVLRMENGVQKIMKVNVKDITEKDAKDKDIVIQQEDIIVVPESFF